MPITFANECHQVATGTAQQDLLSIFKTNNPYLAKLMRFWVMCSDNVYPAGTMLDLELWFYPLATKGSGGTADAGVLQQDQGLSLSPKSDCRQNDTTLVTTAGTPKLIWAGAMQVWQGLDVVLSANPSIANFDGGGPTFDALVLRLATALAVSVKLSAGMLFEESY